MEYTKKEPNGSRSSIWLSETLRTWVAQEAKRNSVSTAEVIRTAVRELKLKVERQEAKAK
jgi:hypothetical protein